MSSDLRDSSSDPLLAFASEAPPARTQVSQQSLDRSTTLDDAEHSILRVEGRRLRRSHVWLVGTLSMGVGILMGLAADVAPWQRLFIRPVTPSISAPSANSQPASAESSTVPTIDPVPRAAPVDAHATSTTKTTGPSRSTALDEAGQGRNARTTKDESRLSTSAQQKATSALQPGTGGAIRVLSRPEGADVILDGNAIGQSPLLIADVPAGTHEVRVELAGFSPWVASVRLKGGSQTRVSASLERQAPSGE